MFTSAICEYVQLGAQICAWDLSWAWACPPLLLEYVAPFLFLSFFFSLRKQEPQKLDPVVFLWLQRRRHGCTLRASSFRTQVFWIVCGSKSMSLWNNECPGAYRSVCRNLFWMECKGSVFIAPVFLSTLKRAVAKPEAVVSSKSLLKWYTAKPSKVEKQVLKIPVWFPPLNREA